MPVVWNAETEAKLLGALFKVTDLKVTQAQMQEIAAVISPGNAPPLLPILIQPLQPRAVLIRSVDCTAKAISHRLAKFRTAGKKEGSEGPSGTPKTPKKAAAATGKGSAGKKRVRKGAEDGEGEDDDEDVGGGKRMKGGEEGDEEGEEGVKVKGEENADGEE
nr:hypothetical protein B0A51_18272 [Rachicladosporium sp. CCFEE 5018]